MFKKSPQLLASMAMRASHDFSFRPIEEQKLAMEKMDKLYDFYASGKTDAQIAEESGIYIVTLKQVREETDGTGFFQG